MPYHLATPAANRILMGGPTRVKQRPSKERQAQIVTGRVETPPQEPDVAVHDFELNRGQMREVAGQILRLPGFDAFVMPQHFD
jgi:hypothetical protein